MSVHASPIAMHAHVDSLQEWTYYFKANIMSIQFRIGLGYMLRGDTRLVKTATSRKGEMLVAVFDYFDLWLSSCRRFDCVCRRFGLSPFCRVAVFVVVVPICRRYDGYPIEASVFARVVYVCVCVCVRVCLRARVRVCARTCGRACM